jgi:2-keto-4-pentenoate hydratase/2-oxohepta-3-ene-1,7-dioic acid hydratase in catechol pathway
MGTQGADGDMVPGDTIEVEISDIGILRNYVVTEESMRAVAPRSLC